MLSLRLLGRPGLEVTLLRGPQVMKETVAASRLAFSDPALEVDDVLTEGDEFALTYTASGTNDGETIGAPASGESAAWPAEPYGGVR